MDWQTIVKKYVWDEKKTPYFVSVDKLTIPQINSEIFVYSLFLAIFFGFLSIIAFSEQNSQAISIPYWVGFYALSVFCSAVALGMRKNVNASRYCLSAPVAVFFYITIYTEFASKAHTIEKYLPIAFTVIWLFYSIRVMAIAKYYQRMPGND